MKNVSSDYRVFVSAVKISTEGGREAAAWAHGAVGGTEPGKCVVAS